MFYFFKKKKVNVDANADADADADAGISKLPFTLMHIWNCCYILGL